MGRLGPNEHAYNAAINALNGFETELEMLIEQRDRAWCAADALVPGTGHGRGAFCGGKRNFQVMNGIPQR